MYDRKKMIMEKIRKLDKGSSSESGRYWCVTCKKLFRIGEPVCPYMTKMCVNTPIAIENISPESAVWVEKMGLFYPKLPQKVMAAMVGEPAGIGKEWVRIYLDFLKDWRIDCTRNPLQTVKSFVIFTSGSETAQRVNEDLITLVLTDMKRIWNKEQLFLILTEALEILRERLDIKQEFALDEMDIIGERPMGRYHCAMCKKFFEFGITRQTVTCPLMAQKCMFDPINIDDIKYSEEGLLKMYRISPDLYKRFIEILPDKEKGRKEFKRVLSSDWQLDPDEGALREFEELLGL